MNNVRQSKKRDAMLALLRQTTCHPSADWVYREMKAEYPDLSLGTVYRNLNHLCERGFIRRVGAVNGQERYDARMDYHDHFVCNRCGAILDLPGHWLDLSGHWSAKDYVSAVGEQYGFTAESHEFTIRGLCKDCKEILTLEETQL